MATLKSVDVISDELFEAGWNGGGTVSTVVGVSVPDSGYVVGVKGKGVVFTGAETIADLDNWIRGVRATSGLPGYFLGVWKDTVDGKVYYDLVQVFAERAVAEKACKARGEIAYWSLTDNKEVRI